ncbi:hypothetical protein N1226_000981 [Escherichia coli]|nr:hypothetical protein [Escherichia coli]
MAITTDNVSATFTWSGPEQGWIITSGVGLGQGRVYSREIFTKILASETSSVTLNTPPTIVDVYADGKRLAESKYSLDGNVITFSPSLPASTELQVIEYTPIQLGIGDGSGSSTITWVYNGGSAIGGETEITLDVVVDDVPAIDINGSRQYKNLGFTFDPLTSKITLAQELEPEDEVVVIINGTPNIYNQIDHTLREVARATNVKDTEVVYFSVGAALSGYKVIYDKETQRAYPLPADIAPGTTAVSLSSSAVLVHSAGSVDLGELAVTREEYVTLSGTFDTGVTVNTKNELVVFTDGKYRWDGVLPKEVSAGSTPETAGGVGAGKWLSVGDVSLRADLLSGGMTDLIGFPGYNNLTAFLHTTVRTVEEFRSDGLTDAQVFQAAINAGNVRVPAGSVINITGNIDITIPANRLIVVDDGGILRSNGRFTAYGVNDVHWVINGLVESTGMVAAPAKSGWPNTAEGTQAGDERGFIEFGGVVFAGNDGKNYSVTGSGHIQGPWSGTPNVSDLANQLNKKGIAAWNCSGFTVEGVSIDGFEGEQVYWFARNADNRDAIFNRVKSTNARFNALNMNVYSATKNIRVIDCYTNNSYNGIESSAGDIINTIHDNPVNTGILFGSGTGGGNRLIEGNQVNECLGTPYSLLYNKDYESRGYVPNVTVVNNTATNPGVHFIAISGITGFKVANNTCYGLKTGRFIQATVLQGGIIENNTNYKPSPGTEHVYRGECYSVEEHNNARVLLGGSYVTAAASDHAITGGNSSAITTFGNRENFKDLRADSPAIGTGAELRYSVDIGAAFTPVSLSMQLTTYGGSGAQADWSINNLKINPNDVLGQSWVSRHTGHWEPGTDGIQNFGSPTRRVNNSYFTVAPTVTSNEMAKTALLDLSEAERNAALEIKDNIRKYKLLDAIAIKGEDGARWHFGVGAQTVGDIMRKHGLNPADYGFWCHDTWEDQYTDVMKKIYTGNTVVNEEGLSVPEYTLEPTGERMLVRTAGENYGIRYDELSMFILSAI